jgi:hypothetical protein
VFPELPADERDFAGREHRFAGEELGTPGPFAGKANCSALQSESRRLGPNENFLRSSAAYRAAAAQAFFRGVWECSGPTQVLNESDLSCRTFPCVGLNTPSPASSGSLAGQDGMRERAWGRPARSALIGPLVSLECAECSVLTEGIDRFTRPFTANCVWAEARSVWVVTPALLVAAVGCWPA